MEDLTGNTITYNQFKEEIINKFIRFENESEQSMVVKTYSDNLLPHLYDAMQHSLKNQDEEIIHQKIQNLLLGYSETIQMHPAKLISIHLFSFTLLNQLENEAEKLNHDYLRNLWSTTADKIAEISETKINQH